MFRGLSNLQRSFLSINIFYCVLVSLILTSQLSQLQSAQFQFCFVKLLGVLVTAAANLLLFFSYRGRPIKNRLTCRFRYPRVLDWNGILLGSANTLCMKIFKVWPKGEATPLRNGNRHQPSQSRVDIEHWLKANTA